MFFLFSFSLPFVRPLRPVSFIISIVLQIFSAISSRFFFENVLEICNLFYTRNVVTNFPGNIPQRDGNRRQNERWIKIQGIKESVVSCGLKQPTEMFMTYICSPFYLATLYRDVSFTIQAHKPFV